MKKGFAPDRRLLRVSVTAVAIYRNSNRNSGNSKSSSSSSNSSNGSSSGGGGDGGSGDNETRVFLSSFIVDSTFSQGSQKKLSSRNLTGIAELRGDPFRLALSLRLSSFFFSFSLFLSFLLFFSVSVARASS